MFDVRKKGEEKNNGIDRNIFLMLRLDLQKNFWRGAMADSAIN